jgi:hypothetical protein
VGFFPSCLSGGRCTLYRIGGGWICVTVYLVLTWTLVKGSFSSKESQRIPTDGPLSFRNHWVQIQDHDGSPCTSVLFNYIIVHRQRLDNKTWNFAGESQKKMRKLSMESLPLPKHVLISHKKSSEVIILHWTRRRCVRNQLSWKVPLEASAKVKLSTRVKANKKL